MSQIVNVMLLYLGGVLICLFLGKKKGCNIGAAYYRYFFFWGERMYFLEYLYHRIQKFVR